jgi:polar amino acid transport system substrate-binding protein
MDVKVHIYVLPYARALKMTESGELDGVFNVTKQASTIEKFNFHQTPLLNANASFYYPLDSRLNYKSINEIPDSTTIALIINYEYEDKYEATRDRFNEVRVSKQKQIIHC